MIQEIKTDHRLDQHERPSGGTTQAVGMDINWQSGPLGRGEERKEPNGAFVETVVLAAKDRLEFYQSTQFRCEENEVAIGHLAAALSVLNDRTQRREEAGVEGTHEGN